MAISLRASVLRHALARQSSTSTRQAARDALRSRSNDISLPILPSCPAPTCQCAEMPADLDIDRSTNLNSSMAPYQEHLIVASGQADWQSKIEDEKGSSEWGNLVANVKNALSLKGQFHNPYHNVVVSTSSFEPPHHASSNLTSRALLFPSFRTVENVQSSQDSVVDFIRTFLLPEKLYSAYDQHSAEERAERTRDTANSSSSRWAGNVHPISAPTILICSHNTRDSRCGILGPILHAEFTQYIDKRHTLRNSADDLVDVAERVDSEASTFTSHPKFRPDLVDRDNHAKHPINVGMISHIGGHKFAGNVIIYIPPDYQCRPIERTSHGTKPQDKEDSRDTTTTNSTSTSSPSSSSSVPLPPEDEVLNTYSASVSPLAGKGIWYGRVEPKHVEGIVEQTIGHGRIIKDLFRGGINADGSQIRLPLY